MSEGTPLVVAKQKDKKKKKKKSKQSKTQETEENKKKEKKEMKRMNKEPTPITISSGDSDDAKVAPNDKAKMPNEDAKIAPKHKAKKKIPKRKLSEISDSPNPIANNPDNISSDEDEKFEQEWAEQQKKKNKN